MNLKSLIVCRVKTNNAYEISVVKLLLFLFKINLMREQIYLNLEVESKSEKMAKLIVFKEENFA